MLVQRLTNPYPLEELQRQMIAETNAFLTECLRHPELAVRIPVVEASRASFPRSMTPAFWERVLNDA